MVYCAVLMVALVGGSFLGWLGQSDVITKTVLQTLMNTRPEDVFKNADGSPKSSLTVLVLGCDEDLAPGGKKVLKSNARSDMILVAKLDFANQRITGVSIPRDTNYQLPGYRDQKINAYHAIGGNQLSQRAVSEMLGVPIDRTVTINYDAFQETVDMLGGVDIFVPRNMRYTDKAGGLFINLKKGRQHLDGYKSMCFVRYRHGDSDFKRQERQKDFIIAVKQQLVANWAIIPKVVQKAVELASNEFSSDEFAALARFAKGVQSEDIRFGMVPVIDGRHYNLELDRARLPETLAEYGLDGDRGSAYTYAR